MNIKGPDGKVIYFPDDTPPEQIKSAMATRYPSPYNGPFPPMSAPGSRMTSDAPPPMPNDFANRALGLLPTAGGAVGGWAGRLAGLPFGGVGAIPGEIAGAGIGGGVGEGLRQLGTGEPLSARGMGAQAVVQGASQGLGMGIGGVAGKIAPGLMQKALGIIPTLADRFNMTQEELAKMVLGKRLGPTIADLRKARAMTAGVASARADALAATPGLVGANAIAATAIAQAEAAARRRLTLAERGVIIRKVQSEANDILSGATFGAVRKGGREIPAQPASRVLNEFGQPAIPASEAIPPPPTRYSPTELEQIKEVANVRARGARNAMRAGLGSPYDPELTQQMAGAAQRNLESRVPGIKGMNAELENMKAAKLAIRSALSKTTGEWTELRFGPLHAGVSIPRDKIGGLALILTSKNFQRIARQSPRAAAAALQQALYPAEADATSQ